jgi:hypothetical protein
MGGSDTIDLRRATGTPPAIYSSSVLDMAAELFGQRSVEYGLTLSGSFDLGTHLQQRFVWNFSGEEVIFAAEGNTAIRDKAVFVVKVKQLIERVEQNQRGKQPPPWFTPPGT